MSSFDPRLLQALAEADAALPPPPGAPLSPERLEQLAARRTTRRLAIAAAALFAIALGIVLATTPAPAAAAAPDLEFAALRADLDRMLAQCRADAAAATAQADDAQRALARRRQQQQLRWELAAARAGGAHAYQTAAPQTMNPLPETRR